MNERRADAFAVVVFGLAGAAAQIGAIASLLGFLRLMSEAGESDTVSWRGFEMTTGLGGLMLASVSLASMLAIAAGANYFSVRRARAIGRACMENTVIGLMDLIERAESLPEGMDERTVRKMGVRGSRLTGVSVESTIQLIGPMAQLVILTGALFWLDAWVTVLLLPALLVPLPVLWRHNRNVRASATLFYDGAAPGFGKAVGRALNTLLQARGANETIRDATIETYRNTPEVQQFYGTYDDMQLTASRAVLITSLFRPLILVYVLFLLGVQITRDDLGWPVAIAYLLMLIQLTSRAEGLVAQFSVLSRLYTQVEPFVRFSSHVLKGARPNRDPQGGESHDDAVEFIFGGRVVPLSPGRPVQIYTGRSYGRLGLPLLFNDLAPAVSKGAESLRRAAFVGRRYQPSGASAERLMTGLIHPTDDALERIRALADALGTRAEIESRFSGALDAKGWSEMSPEARVVVQLGPALCGDAPVLIIDMGILAPLERAGRSALFEQLSGRSVIVLAPDYGSGCAHAESVIVLEADRVVWAGERAAWLENPERAALVSDKIGRSRGDSADEIDEELE